MIILSVSSNNILGIILFVSRVSLVFAHIFKNRYVPLAFNINNLKHAVRRRRISNSFLMVHKVVLSLPSGQCCVLGLLHFIQRITRNTNIVCGLNTKFSVANTVGVSELISRSLQLQMQVTLVRLS